MLWADDKKAGQSCCLWLGRVLIEKYVLPTWGQVGKM